MNATVTFSAAVDITGTPQLELDFDGTPKAANCTAAMNTTTMVCSYTVAVGDVAAGGIAIAANKLTLNGGTIKQSSSTTINAVPTHAAVAIDANHKVDGVRPTLVTSGDDAPQTSVDGTQVIYTFSEDIGSVTLNNFNLEVNNGPNQQVGATATISGRTVTVTLLPAFTIQYGQAVEITLAAGSVRDTAGNRNSPIEDQAVTNKVPQPPAVILMVEITSDPGMDSNYATGDDIEVTATFTQAVAVTGKPRILLLLGGGGRGERWAEYASGSGTTALVFSYTVLATDESDTDGIEVGKPSLLTEDVDLNGGTITVTATGEDASLSYAPLVSDSGHRVNWVRPTLTGAVTSTDGTKVILTFSEDLTPGGRNITLFTVKVAGSAVTLSGTVATVSGDVVTLTLATALTSATQTVTVSYAKATIGTTGIEDLAGNDADSFTDQTVTNRFGSTTAPTVTGVEITSVPVNATNIIAEGIEVAVTFSAAVDITGTPQLELDFDGTAKAANCTAATNTTTMACSYTVVENDSAPNGIAIAANKLTLNGGTITATGSTTIDADLAHAAVAIDAGQKVEGSRPTLVTTGTDAPTTSTDGTQVILTFSKDIGSVDRTKITIGIGGGNVAQTSAARVVGTEVELDLSTVIDATVMLTVALSVEAVRDGAGNGNLAVPATAVINAIGSTTAPTVTAVALTSAPDDATYGYKIGDAVEATVTFDAAVDITGTPQLELDFDGTPKPADCTADTGTEATLCSYTVVMGDSAPNGIAIAANTLTLNGGTIRATGSTTANADLDHGAVAIDAGQKVDGIRPTLVTTGSEAPTTSTDGTTVILTFSEAIRSVNRASITIQANGVTLSTTAASRAGNKAELTLATALTATATNLTVSLATNSVFDPAGNGILAVAATAVTNAVGAPDPPGTLKARRGDGEVHLEWVPVAAVPTDPDRAYQLRYGAEGGESNQWRDIPGSAPGGPHARSYTVTGLENGTRYAFELRVRRGSGVGTAAKIRQTPEAARWSVSTNRRSVHEGEDVTLSIATRNAVGFYSAPEALTLAVLGQIVLEFATIKGADPEDFEIRVDGHTVQGYTKDITLLNFDKDLDRDPFPAQHFDVEVPVGSTSLDVTVTVLADDEEDGQEHMTFMVFRGEELVNEDTWDETGVNIESRDAGVVKAARGGRCRGDGGRGPVAGLRGDARAGGGMDGDRGLCDPRRHRAGGLGLHGHERRADLRARRDGEDGVGAGHRRHGGGHPGNAHGAAVQRQSAVQRRGGRVGVGLAGGGRAHRGRRRDGDDPQHRGPDRR